MADGGEQDITAGGDTGVHEVAMVGFGSDADRYEVGRPSYPPDAVAWLCEHTGIDATSTVIDVGAGTGKLTRLLEPEAERVIAVEPVAAMAAKLLELSPGVEHVTGSAENLPLDGAAADAITVAQAFHWFDADAAWREFRRVLRPGGGVGLIWNARDRSVDWVNDVWTIMDGVENAAPWLSHDSPPLRPGPGFGDMEAATFWHDVTVTPRTMLDRVASVSHVAVLPERERQAILRDVANALPARDHLSVRYRVDVYATRLEAAAAS